MSSMVLLFFLALSFSLVGKKTEERKENGVVVDSSEQSTIGRKNYKVS